MFGVLLGRPAEWDAQQLAATDLTGGFDHHAVLAGLQRFERRLLVRKLQAVAAHCTGGAADAINRHFQAAAATAPPLAQVLEPLFTFLVLELGVVPHRQIGNVALVRALEPDGDIGAVVLGDIQAGDFHVQLQVRRV